MSKWTDDKACKIHISISNSRIQISASDEIIYMECRILATLNIQFGTLKLTKNECTCTNHIIPCMHINLSHDLLIFPFLPNSHLACNNRHMNHRILQPCPSNLWVGLLRPCENYSFSIILKYWIMFHPDSHGTTLALMSNFLSCKILSNGKLRLGNIMSPFPSCLQAQRSFSPKNKKVKTRFVMVLPCPFKIKMGMVGSY